MFIFKTEIMSTGKEIFPFSAIVGQEAMKMALILNLVDPTIGGVLIRGQKGTGKSTAIRALPGILPLIKVVKSCPYHCPPDEPRQMHNGCLARYQSGEKLPWHQQQVPLIELPLNATEDRLAGTLDITKTLATGEIQFQPGLLASANRGILYIDEVNLLDDHLVDLLLDAAASGRNYIEREGISYSHPSHFILIGTMNPEEGELRPQLLDRFALCVEISGLIDEKQRQEIVRRRLLFDQDPSGVISHFAAEEAQIKKQIAQAQKHLHKVQIPDDIVEKASKLAVELQVHGHRTDINIIKAARALAALLDIQAVSEIEFLEVAPLVLIHRLKKNPLDTFEIMQQKIRRAMLQVLGHSRASVTPPAAATTDEIDVDAESMQIPGSAAAGSILFDFLKSPQPPVRPSFRIGERLISPVIEADAKRLHFNKRRYPDFNRGRATTLVPWRTQTKLVHISFAATLRAYVRRQISIPTPQRKAIAPEDIHYKKLKPFRQSLIIFLVDASESMLSEERMQLVKGFSLMLLNRVNRNRCAVAIVVFSGEQARIILQPTRSIQMTREQITDIPCEGTTPMAAGLQLTLQLIRAQKRKKTLQNITLIVLSDGEANIPLIRNC